MKNSLRIIYLSNERLPAKMACTIQQVAMCEAFAKTGADVQLVYPKYHDQPAASAQHIYDFYGVTTTFKMKQIFSFLSLSKPISDGSQHIKIPYVGGISILVSSAIYALTLFARDQLGSSTVIYSRNVNAAYVFLKLKRCFFPQSKIFFEVHALDQQQPRHLFYKILRESDGLICITNALKEALLKVHRSPKTIFIAPDGVKGSVLNVSSHSPKSARQRLNIVADKIVMYTGQIVPGKGADVFIEAAAFFNINVTFYLVGGEGVHWQAIRQKVMDKKLKNVQLTGFVPPAQVTHYQAAADVLVLPPTADHVISPYTSPLKLFEYMAARRPIVASNLPVLGEILTDRHNALLFQERDAADLAAKIQLLLENGDLADFLAANAWRTVQNFSWEKRAERIVDFMMRTSV
ncbi:glycosyltransferase [candidate division KSB1 bacterium]|nr:glycosyltransferase [candidate division KSB1 bacterium]RQW04162.1 MAG: glycosyltransferase [candidate division KSB1 bacterium]